MCTFQLAYRHVDLTWINRNPKNSVTFEKREQCKINAELYSIPRNISIEGKRENIKTCDGYN